MKMILHDWDDTHATKVLRNCRRASKPSGRVLAADVVLDPDHGAPLSYFLDLQFLVLVTGKERARDEFRALYKAAGLRLTWINPTESLFFLVEGVAL